MPKRHPQDLVGPQAEPAWLRRTLRGCLIDTPRHGFTSTAAGPTLAALLELFPELFEFVVPHVLVSDHIHAGVSAIPQTITRGATWSSLQRCGQKVESALVHKAAHARDDAFLPCLCFLLHLCQWDCARTSPNAVAMQLVTVPSVKMQSEWLELRAHQSCFVCSSASAIMLRAKVLKLLAC